MPPRIPRVAADPRALLKDLSTPSSRIPSQPRRWCSRSERPCTTPTLPLPAPHTTTTSSDGFCAWNAPCLLPRPHRSRAAFSTATALRGSQPTLQPENHDDYYAELLAQPLPVSAATRRPIGASPIAAATTANVPDQPAEQTPAERAKIVFGSRLLSPASRTANLDDARQKGEGEWIAGRWVPPRPGEPDNCCMSGCVNCVWDLYREDLEEWAATRNAAKAEERKRLRKQAGSSMMSGIQGDEDGLASRGASDGFEIGEGDESIDGLMRDVPVGIREFMRTEKMLRERHRRESLSGS